MRPQKLASIGAASETADLLRRSLGPTSRLLVHCCQQLIAALRDNRARLQRGRAQRNADWWRGLGAPKQPCRDDKGNLVLGHRHR
jgi:hypothetical protein